MPASQAARSRRPTPPPWRPGSFFFSSRRRHTRSYGDWSSDVCSSDLARDRAVGTPRAGGGGAPGHHATARRHLPGAAARRIRRAGQARRARRRAHRGWALRRSAPRARRGARHPRGAGDGARSSLRDFPRAGAAAARARMTPTRVLVAGVSTRGFAESAARAGYDVLAVDGFGDLDLRACARAVLVARTEEPGGGRLSVAPAP